MANADGLNTRRNEGCRTEQCICGERSLLSFGSAQVRKIFWFWIDLPLIYFNIDYLPIYIISRTAEEVANVFQVDPLRRVVFQVIL